MQLNKRLAVWLAAPFAVLAAIIASIVVLIAIYGWNWARGPIQRAVYSQTGRVLTISGDLIVKPRWPVAQVQASDVTFANPAWASQPQMLDLAAGTVDIDLRELLSRKWALPVV